MKNVFKRLQVPAIILLILLILYLLARHFGFFGENDKEKNLSEIAVPIAIQCLNARGFGDPVQPENVTIEIDDPAGQLITAARNPIPEIMVLPDGLMSLGLKTGAVFSQDTPYIFTVHAIADDFLENTLTITITSGVPKYEPVFMTSRNGSSFGINFSTGTIGFGPNGVLTNSLSLASTVINKGENPIDSTLTTTFSISEGTQLLNEDCTAPIQAGPGEVSLTVGNFNPRFPAAANAFPGGAVVYKAIDSSGEQLQVPFIFASYGYLNVEMKVGDEIVGGFEGELPEVSMEVASDYVNPDTGEPVQVGDVIPVWSLNSKTGQWKQEANVVIAENEGKLVANFKIPHLSFWNLDSPTTKCVNPVVVNLDNTGNPFRVRYIELVDDIGNIVTPVRNTAGNVFHLPAGATTSFDIINTPPATNFSIRVHQTFQQSSAVSLNQAFSTCATEPDPIAPVNVSLPNDAGNCRELVFRLFCPGTGDCLFLPSSVGLWVGISGGTPMFAGFFSSIGTLDFDMTTINAGDDLDFIIWYDADGDPLTTAGEQITFTTTGDFTDIQNPVTNIILDTGTPGNCSNRVTFEILVPFTCVGSNFDSFIAVDSDCDPST